MEGELAPQGLAVCHATRPADEMDDDESPVPADPAVQVDASVGASRAVLAVKTYGKRSDESNPPRAGAE
jgi:hypothetical protein